ncbi:MAG: DUF47 family protein [Thermotogaceae bacterium]|nr:DUF47 family protein [Thermotogaceae bacterium]
MERFFKKLFPKVSPVELIERHAHICHEVAKDLQIAIKKYLDGQPLEEYERLVDRYEKDSDEIKTQMKKIYSNLRWSFFDKAEVRKLISDQEKMVDITDDIIKLLTMNQIDEIPQDIKDMMMELTSEVVKSVENMVKTIYGLEKVAESSFSPAEIEKEEMLMEKVEKDETLTDEIGKKLGQRIFSLKNSMNPVDVIFLGRITTMLMEVADLAENAAERIKLLFS